jgi:hypothetical protein
MCLRRFEDTGGGGGGTVYPRLPDMARMEVLRVSSSLSSKKVEKLMGMVRGWV